MVLPRSRSWKPLGVAAMTQWCRETSPRQSVPRGLFEDREVTPHAIVCGMTTPTDPDDRSAFEPRAFVARSNEVAFCRFRLQVVTGPEKGTECRSEGAELTVGSSRQPRPRRSDRQPGPRVAWPPRSEGEGDGIVFERRGALGHLELLSGWGDTLGRRGGDRLGSSSAHARPRRARSGRAPASSRPPAGSSRRLLRVGARTRCAVTRERSSPPAPGTRTRCPRWRGTNPPPPRARRARRGTRGRRRRWRSRAPTRRSP